MTTEVFPQSASINIEHATINNTTQGRKIFSVSNGGYAWTISASYRNLSHDKWIILQENLLRTYGTYAVFKFYVKDIYPNATGFSISSPIAFNASGSNLAGNHSIILNNVNSYATTNSFKTGDILYHPKLGPGNMNIVAGDVQVTSTTCTIPLVRPIRSTITAGESVSLADFVYVSMANKDWNVSQNVAGYFDIDVDFIVRDKFRNYV